MPQDRPPPAQHGTLAPPCSSCPVWPRTNRPSVTGLRLHSGGQGACTGVHPGSRGGDRDGKLDPARPLGRAPQLEGCCAHRPAGPGQTEDVQTGPPLCSAPRAPHPPSRSPSRVLAASSEDDRVSWHSAQSSRAALRRVWVTGREGVTAGAHTLPPILGRCAWAPPAGPSTPKPSQHPAALGGRHCGPGPLPSRLVLAWRGPLPERPEAAPQWALSPGASAVRLVRPPGLRPREQARAGRGRGQGAAILACRACPRHVPLLSCDVPEGRPARDLPADGQCGLPVWTPGGRTESAHGPDASSSCWRGHSPA